MLSFGFHKIRPFGISLLIRAVFRMSVFIRKDPLMLHQYSPQLVHKHSADVSYGQWTFKFFMEQFVIYKSTVNSEHCNNLETEDTLLRL